MRYAARAVVALLLSIATAAALSSAASAQSEAEQTALARDLFAQGLEHLQGERYDEAAEVLERSYELRSAPGIGYNLAAAYEGLGRWVEALELARQALAHESVSEEVRGLAEAMMSRLGPRLGRLRIDVTGDASGARITLDGEEVMRAAIGVPAPVDPGAHDVAAEREGRVVASEAVEVGEGATVDVTLDLGEPTVDPGPDLTATTTTEDPNDTGSILGEWWFWTVVGAVVVGGLATVLLLTADSTEDPLQGTAGIVVWR